MTPKQRAALAVGLITSFIAPFMSSSLNLCVNAISSEFQSGATTVTWVVSAYALATAVFSIPLGRLADVKGRRVLLAVGTIGFTITSILSATAFNIYYLIGLRVAMAIFSDAIVASNVTLMLLAFPPERRGWVLGLVGAVVGLGLSAGPVAGGFINSVLNWRYVFVFGAIVGAVTAYLSVFKIDRDAPKETLPFDRTGTVLFMVSLSTLMLGLAEWTSYVWAPFCALVGLALVVAFVVYEMRVEHPVMQVRFFVTHKLYGRANIAALLKMAAYYAVSYTMAIYLVVVQGLDSAIAGLVLLFQPVLQAIMSPIAGNLSDRMRATNVTSAGVAIITCGLFGLSFVDRAMPLWAIIVCLAVIGFGNAFFVAPNNSVIISSVEPKHYSEANATITAMRGIGQSLSIVIVSLILGATVGNTVLAEIGAADLAYAIHVTMLVCTVISIGAFLCSLPPRSNRKKNAHGSHSSKSAQHRESEPADRIDASQGGASA